MKKITVISEIGVNHSGDLALAHKMIEMSKETGCDIAKFQYYDAVKLLGKDHPVLDYALSCHFTKEQLEELKRHCDAIGIEFLVSVFDAGDVSWASSVCKRMKVATRMNNNKEFVDACKETGKQVLISTQAPYITENPKEKYLYCVPKYPTKIKEISIPLLENCEGFSTHCPDIGPALYAVSHNCRIVEAHTTIDRGLPGCDMSSSWTFSEMKQFVNIVRTWEKL